MKIPKEPKERVGVYLSTANNQFLMKASNQLAISKSNYLNLLINSQRDE